ncbi:MAG TPA: hypothetical protein PK385_03050 [Spirochaetota bacterium]|nr:hypothetical protein [Spirochaetota bacterium]HOS32032.1 hypothetical protein [Spirochaetota bacterium]HOS55016.1 hypothetical protein [Spirochaetota bacterium]HPK61001.1 hypothetical protein [Spirochaetota bacterium]HQF77567.1 hypothetical protein [Spirochaetota bacterium]
MYRKIKFGLTVVLISLALIGCDSIKSVVNKFPKIKFGESEKSKKIDKNALPKYTAVLIEKGNADPFIVNLKKKILKDFYKESGIRSKLKYFALDRVPYENRADTGDFDIIFERKDRYKGKYFLSDKIFSNAVYFLIDKSKEANFNYPKSFLTENVGAVFNSNSHIYVESFNDLTKKKNLEIKNLSLYSNEYSLIDDFLKRQLDIIILDRTTFYENAPILPASILFFIEYGEPYDGFTFKDKSVKEKFDRYLESRKSRERDYFDLIKNKSIEKKFKLLIKNRAP